MSIISSRPRPARTGCYGATVTAAVLTTPFNVAVMFTGRLVVVDPAVTIIEPLVDPAGIVTDPGATDISAESLDTFTGKPPAGAALPIVTFTVTGFPLLTAAGETTILIRVGALTARGVVTAIPPVAAFTVTAISAETGTGVMVVATELVPAATVTLAPAGMTFPSELESRTATPAGPALPVRPIFNVTA